MANTLFVGNLPYQATEANLKTLFTTIGLVTKVELVKDRRGRSLGYGFVTMSNQTEARQALTKLNNYPLKINSAKRNLHLHLHTSGVC